ncbi:hypothetical protein [Mycobacterium sp. AZCC_0083]|uniref:hypothetical protein n=1 Tax=Mycobacterium sp. AZCC_0083 TaxID=2735882 RepID=UPI00160FF6C1|nr:hypothetical protein [Mycobacterium sp. AZCC_0083]MBB5161171.1 hypothetical protein [Mycobacterium sp. AZCC_0083]
MAGRAQAGGDRGVVVAVGGKRLWRNRHHLDQTGMTEVQWRARWDAARMFLTADGGCPALGDTLAAADFRSGHSASRRGGRDRQAWSRDGDQATAGRTP